MIWNNNPLFSRPIQSKGTVSLTAKNDIEPSQKPITCTISFGKQLTPQEGDAVIHIQLKGSFQSKTESCNIIEVVLDHQSVITPFQPKEY